MLTKAEAQALVTGYLKALPDRVAALVEANARSGVLGCSFSYAGIPAAVVNNAKTALAGIGWTVADDNVNFIITLS